MPGERSEIDALTLLFSDVDRLTDFISRTTASYKLLVSAAEEFGRILGAGQATVNRAIDRADNLGTLIDFTIISLAMKLDFVLEVLSAPGVPLQLVVELLDEATRLPRDPDNLLPGPEERRRNSHWRTDMEPKWRSRQRRLVLQEHGQEAFSNNRARRNRVICHRKSKPEDEGDCGD